MVNELQEHLTLKGNQVANEMIILSRSFRIQLSSVFISISRCYESDYVKNLHINY